MKTQLKLISCFAVMAFSCAGLFSSASLHAQSGNPDALSTPMEPDANKKEAPADAPASPTPTPTPAPSPSPSPSR